LTPVVILLHWHRGVRRWSARRFLPDWLADAVDLTLGSVRSGCAYVVTLFYTVSYARHFYCRVGLLVQGRPLFMRGHILISCDRFRISWRSSG
jgi:hypothetical protein